MKQHILDIDLELIAKLDRNGPRYTSYPTADRFSDRYSSADYAKWTQRRNRFGVPRPLSIYVHLPFCSSLCYYCACNKIITRDASKSERYLGYLLREIDMQAALFRNDTRVSQMHWGGGTPTFYRTDDLERLYSRLKARFTFDEDGEYSIEIDPRTVDPATMLALRQMGFNRASLGVQDFDPDVQQAVNRVQSEEQTAAVVECARRAGFGSLNMDLIYGLPRQSVATFSRTLERVVALRPERIAVYNYAHLPSRFKAQRLIVKGELPTAATKLQLLGLAARELTQAGYVYIGMDHFALPDDPLAVAQREGRLQRNFQGYSTHPECDLIGLGTSAIGSMGASYSQNARTLPEYYALLDLGELPVVRGIELDRDDLARRSVIQQLMCNFELSMKTIEVLYLLDFERYFAPELAQLERLAALGLLELKARSIEVTPKGRMLIRNIGMVFDRHLQRDAETVRYSRTI